MSALIRATGVRAGRSSPWALVLLSLGFCFSHCLAAHKSNEANMFPDHANRVSDPESQLDAGLTVLRDGGGVQAVVVELRNSSDRDVVLKINSEMSAFIMLTLTDEQGTVLSKPARKFSSSEPQRFETVRLGRASSREWRVPIAARLEASAIPVDGLKGRLVVNVALLFCRTNDGAQADDADFKSSLLTLYDMDVSFTPAALSGGASPPAAGR